MNEHKPNEEKKMSVTIKALQVEGFKRIKAVTLKPTPTGLTVIGGGNGEGKTSLLDSITFLLGGEKHRPSEVNNTDSEGTADLHIEMSDGLIVERKGKKGALKVTDANGMIGGQTLLNKFVEQLALNLPKFLEMTGKEKGETILRICGGGDRLAELDVKEKALYDRRRDAGRDADQARAALESMAHHDDVPDKAESMTEILNDIECAQKLNRDRGEMAEELESILQDVADCEREIQQAKDVIAMKEQRLDDVKIRGLALRENLEGGKMIDVEPLKQKLIHLERDQEKARENEAYAKQDDSADELAEYHRKLERALTDVRAERAAFLDEIEMPLEGLSIVDGELTYNGAKWDCMSGADQLMVAASIVKQLNPDCGFVLIDKLEQMDLQTLQEFGTWAEAQGLQIIATRVSTGDECSIVIEDGRLVEKTVGVAG